MQLLLTYSNHQEYPLSFIGNEKVEVDKIFDDLDAKGILRYKIVPSVKVIEDLTSWIKYERAKELVIFSFSGHSTGTRLILEDEYIRCEGLANLLGRDNCPNIKLVFLNGCLTYRCRSFFEKKDIPIIISTTGVISDRLAKIFSTIFFQSLAEYATIYDSYNKAVSTIQHLEPIRKDEVSPNEAYIPADEEKLDEIVSDWDIYFKEDRFKKWNLRMGLEDPKLDLTQNVLSKRTITESLSSFIFVFKGDSVFPSDCTDLKQILSSVKINLKAFPLTSLQRTIVYEYIDRITPQIDQFRTICLHESRVKDRFHQKRSVEIAKGLEEIIRILA